MTTMLYGSEYWTVYRKIKQKISVGEMTVSR